MTSFPKKHIWHSERRKYQPKKKLFKVKKNDVTVNDNRHLLLFYFTDFEWVFVG